MINKWELGFMGSMAILIVIAILSISMIINGFSEPYTGQTWQNLLIFVVFVDMGFLLVCTFKLPSRKEVIP